MDLVVCVPGSCPTVRSGQGSRQVASIGITLLGVAHPIWETFQALIHRAGQALGRAPCRGKGLEPKEKEMEDP